MEITDLNQTIAELKKSLQTLHKHCEDMKVHENLDNINTNKIIRELESKNI